MNGHPGEHLDSQIKCLSLHPTISILRMYPTESLHKYKVILVEKGLIEALLHTTNDK